MEYAALVPCLNPAEKLLGLIKALKEEGFSQIIVVDDGSRAECGPLFAKAGQMSGCAVLSHPENRGKGAAIKTGLQYAKAQGISGVVTMDCDGQHTAKDAMRIARAMGEVPRPALVLGERDFDAPNVPPKSRAGNRITSTLFHLMFGKYIKDTQTGLRGIPKESYDRCIALKGDRYEYEMHMLIHIVTERLPVCEVTIQTIYNDVQNSDSHFRPLRDSMRIYRLLFASFLGYAGVALLSFLLDFTLFTLLMRYAFGGQPNGIFISTAIARVISSMCNYFANKKYVFHSARRVGKTMWQYYALAACQMLLSAGLVYLGSKQMKIGAPYAKVAVDSLLFFGSFWVQKRVIFRE